MLTLPSEIMPIMQAFMPVFSERIWDWVKVLMVGAILSPKQRTVSAALRVVGKGDERQFQNYHRVFNRARWSGLALSRVMLVLLAAAFVPAGGQVVIAGDETLERRRGEKIKALGFFRDGVRSSQKHKNISPALRWVSLMLLVKVPWSSRAWALPFLTVLAPSKETNTANGKRHKSSIDWVRQMTGQVRRWLPGREIVLVVDGGLVAHQSASRCAGYREPIAYISRLQMNARLFDPPMPKTTGKRGRQPIVGPRQSKPQDWLDDPDTPWQQVTLDWYSGKRCTMDVLNGTALWYPASSIPLLIRWVLVRDPSGALRPQVFLCTDLDLDPALILAFVVQRWSVEVTFEEVRAHLGFETQRQWNDLAIARISPLILGLFSLICLFAHRLFTLQSRSVTVSPRSTAWYSKPEVTFSDLIAHIRLYLWNELFILRALSKPNSVSFSRSVLSTLVETLCFAT
jgi:hypothetical protein